MFREIPTYENGQWDVTTFYTREEFRDFLLSIFKEPGKYNFNETSKIFNEEGRKFQKQGYYCAAPVKQKTSLPTGTTKKLNAVMESL